MNYRVYFNRQNEAPQIWSVDEGDQSSEINVRAYQLHRITGQSAEDLSVKANRDTPTAWLEITYAVMEVRDGVAHFFRDPNWRTPRIGKL